MVAKTVVTQPRGEKLSCWSDKHALSWFLAGYMFNSLWSEEIIILIYYFNCCIS